MKDAQNASREQSLTGALCALLASRRTAALGTLDASGAAFVSMVPFATDAASASLVIHISALAAHSQNLRAQPQASLMVAEGEVAGEPVHALARVSIEVVASWAEPASALAAQCRTAYLARFPEAEPMTTLGDFRFVRLTPQGARQVAGFGAARSLSAIELAQAIGQAAK
jgi:putative heme iron utilization protein